MKKWLKITITTNPVLVDSISDFLIGVVGGAVEIGVDDYILLTPLKCFVTKANPTKEEIIDIVNQVNGNLRDLAGIFEVDTPDLIWEIIEDEDWGKTWKAHFSSFAIIPGLVIAPTWEKYQKSGNEHVIVMDPGMAFGTGHHATTALTLELLAEDLQDATLTNSILDVGTGTGILGMAAAHFGAKRVLGIDNDPEAVMAARENVERNYLTSVMEVGATAVSDLEEQYSLLMANIIHDVLVEMAADFVKVTKNEGRLILSGILQGQQAENIISVFQNLGFSLEKKRQRDEWAALLFKKTR